MKKILLNKNNLLYLESKLQERKLINKYEIEIDKYLENLKTFYDESKLQENEKIELEKIIKNKMNFVKNNSSFILNTIENETIIENVNLIELEHCFKTYERIREKVFSNYLATKNYENSINLIEDMLRFTYIVEEESKYTETVYNILNHFINNNFNILEIYNLWGNELYQGLNIILEYNNIKFEVQFHTKNSYKIKEGKTRKVYIVARNKKSDIKMIEKANTIRKYYQKFVKIPPGMENFDFKENNTKVLIKRSFI